MPTLPGKNPTPDELSKPSKPDWLDPDYDDDPDSLMTNEGKLAVEDEDTAEILIGER